MARLVDPDSQQHYSPLGAQPAFVVDLGAEDGTTAADARLARAESRLLGLACPTIGLSPGQPSRPAARLAASLDLVVSSEEELERVLSRISGNPVAAMTLAQLLRHNSGASLVDGLLAESMAYSTLQSGPEFARWLAAYRADRGEELRAESPESAAPVLFRREDERLDIELNRPGRRNAFSSAMRDGLAEALGLALGDSSIGMVRISGRGPDFCSGGDLSEFGTLDDPATAHAVRSTMNVARMLAELGERLEFHLHGACVGAGIELPAFAGRVVAAPGSAFELPELSMGLVPGAGGTVGMLGRIGRQRLAYMAFTGRTVPADLALAWGLVDEIDR